MASNKTYNFHSEWEHDYFFTEVNGKSICLLCKASVALAKKGNKVQQLKNLLLTQPKMFTRPAEKNIATTVASYRVSQVIARCKKPFEDGEMIKESFLEATDSLFDHFKNKSEIISAINSLQLSARTVTRRVEVIVDLTDTSKLAMFVRMVFSDFEVKEELVKIIPLKGHTRGEDIYSKLFVERIPVSKFFSYHCIIHQQALCAKFLNMNDVMKTVIKIVNKIRAHALQRILFRELIEELEIQHGELPFHTEVRWLSKGKVLYRFNQLLPAILTFLKERNEETFVGILKDLNWLQDFAFLVDITEKLNDLNLKLQGKDKHILEMISEVKAFSEKLTLWEKNVMREELKHFPTLNKQIETAEIPYERERFFKIITSLKEEFEKRFSDFKRIELVCQFVLFPLSNINVEVSALIEKEFHKDPSSVELELISLRNDLAVKSVADPINLWPVVPNEKYPHLISVAQQKEYRTRLTDDHLDSCIRLGVTNYSPDFKKIVDESECQVSH
ncbi:hypothetical protein GDO86_000717 [Hymenochirus boettgeri]|uniref:DUF4371 domain-containing protein n=1 Tax=Hymenochirus boettgeri TaxID=247094 RepID=A0A8T2KBZ6_9PIPI|nr:hypothetical protein GDO86_000717 [Hymenochirus boettgeri]